MSLSYVDFIAKNVEVCVKYFVNREARWYKGRIVKVLDRYLDENLDECVKCIVKYDKEKFTDVFCEKDYNTDDENAWCFAEQFVAMIENVKSIVDEFDETEDESEDEPEDELTDDIGQETDSETQDGDDRTSGSDEESSSQDVSEDSDTTTTTEEYKVVEKRHVRQRKHSVGAMLFMLAPWIASGVALFNARKEIFEALTK